MNALAVSGLLILISCFSLAVWIYLKAPKNLPNHLIAAFNICVSIWGLGCLIAGLAKTPESAIWGWRISHIGGFPLGMVFLHLSLVLSKAHDRRVVVGTYLFAVIASLLCLHGIAMSRTEWLFDSIYYHVGNTLYRWLFWTWVVLVIWGHYKLYRGYQSAVGLERVRLRLVFYALATGFIGGCTALLPMIGIRIYPYGNLSIPIYTAILTYAIVRYGVTDIRIVITRAGILLGIYLLVLGIPVFVGWQGRVWLEFRLGHQWWLVPMGLCMALATAGPFAYAYLRNQAEQRLLKKKLDYQRTLKRAAQGMTQVRNTRRLAQLITRIVSRSVRVAHASLFLWDKESSAYVLRASQGPRRLALQSRYRLADKDAAIQELINLKSVVQKGHHSALRDVFNDLNAEIIIPGFIDKRFIGFLILGQKISGNEFTADDLHAFEMLAHEGAIALENASSYEELLRLNEQLKAASERLLFQERLAAAGQFAMGMAHEVKNPLSAIKTFAQYLPEKYADAGFRNKFFRIVQSEIDRINEIVKELSDFAKPSPLDLKPVQLSILVEDTVTLLSDQALKQGVALKTAFEANGAAVLADHGQLKQILLNIFLNSLEAMEKGGQLTAATKLSGEKLVLTVSDTGCGISAEHLKKVWDPFFTTKERGMGLGLAIVKGVIERHGGSIDISSYPDKGTSIAIALPLA